MNYTKKSYVWEKTTRRKDYTEKGLHKRSITHYTEKKIYGKRPYRRRDYIKDGVGLYEEELHRTRTELYK